MTFDSDILNRLFRYCMALCGERENARDLLHDALEKYLRNNPKDLQKPEAYIRRIVRNTFIDQLRQRNIDIVETPIDTDLLASSEKSLEAMTVDKFTLEEIWKKLTPLEREVIYLWSVDGMSASEIALQIGQSRNTVLSRLHRLRQRIQSSDVKTQEGAT
ncbi:MAG: RNA polymerase sigma factor [Methylophilaceae bacterium]